MSMNKSKCKVNPCDKTQFAGGWCSGHYRQMYMHGKITQEVLAKRDHRKAGIEWAINTLAGSGWGKYLTDQAKKEGIL